MGKTENYFQSSNLPPRQYLGKGSEWFSLLRTNSVGIQRCRRKLFCQDHITEVFFEKNIEQIKKKFLRLSSVDKRSKSLM